MANPKATIYKPGEYIDHTAAATITAGDPVQAAGGIIGIAVNDIASAGTDALLVSGIVKIEHVAVVGNIGDNVWWDADGSPYSGTASSGAATMLGTDGDWWMGTLAQATTTTSTHCYVHLNKANPNLPHWPERTWETKSANYTIDAQDVGKVIEVDTDAFTFTLPATSVGIDVIFVNVGADAAVAVNLSPNANDKIMGADVAGTDNKDQINTKTTAIHGDWMHIVSEGTNGWYIIGSRGTWAEEA